MAYRNGLAETDANDGTVSGAVVMTLTDETFTTDAVSAGHVTVTNVPAGLTAVFTRNSNTRVTLRLTGKASAHNSDVSNLSVEFADAAFAGGDASAVAGSSKTDLAIDFQAAVDHLHGRASPRRRPMTARSRAAW